MILIHNREARHWHCLSISWLQENLLHEESTMFVMARQQAKIRFRKTFINESAVRTITKDIFSVFEWSSFGILSECTVSKYRSRLLARDYAQVVPSYFLAGGLHLDFGVLPSVVEVGRNLKLTK